MDGWQTQERQLTDDRDTQNSKRMDDKWKTDIKQIED